jgi:hypothetical protein
MLRTQANVAAAQAAALDTHSTLPTASNCKLITASPHLGQI